MTGKYFQKFEHKNIQIDDASLSVRMGGRGDPLLLLHGYPQTHACWGKVADSFADHFTCIAVDLPGYGDSSVPKTVPDHFSLSKRYMAGLMVKMMKSLGFDKFNILGHDRGARVAYRLALDHGQAVDKLGIIEVIPTAEMWDRFNAEMALKAYHWPFLAQPAPLPEKMIGGDPEAYLDWTLKSWTKDKSLEVFSAEALESYRRQFRDPARIHAMCEDYRAGATIDRELDIKDRQAGNKIIAPLHFVYSDGGFPAQTGDPASLWKNWASKVTVSSACGGHFVQEENPAAILDSFIPFFSA